MYGSPPRAWGIHQRGGELDTGQRFTPTCVGNTQRGHVRVGMSAVHPHVRGEYNSGRPSRPSSAGSPPRAWGIRYLVQWHTSRSWFTPTCVGNTWIRRPPAPARSVHPHVRGEYELHRHPRRPIVGSPPRAWGIHQHRSNFRPAQRFTPTCVGNTLPGGLLSCRLSVHPHVRGEYAFAVLVVTVATGSPPRAWGIRNRPGSRRLACRFSPTCVGNTRYLATDGIRAPVHPHVRGEYGLGKFLGRARDGSPPRAWGIQRPRHHLVVRRRFTPTCVGNTRSARSTSGGDSVHPHVRGEYAGHKFHGFTLPGSPPRAWGILILVDNH